MKTFADFEAFYAYYLASHSDPWNRRIHLLGWVAGIVVGAWAVFTLKLWLLPLAAAGGLGIALLGHRFIEHNDSVVFAYPLWTTCADVRMFSDMARGRLPF
ncbi:MAG: DUF962 domain-containing protein [Aquabacterium sp.]|nr:MAG: DUF962 domain-containing protein [Aquabacterium sp.]